MPCIAPVFSAVHNICSVLSSYILKIKFACKMQSKSSSLNWQLSKGLSVSFSWSVVEQYPTAHMSTLRRHPYSLYRLCIVNVVVQVQLLPL